MNIQNYCNCISFEVGCKVHLENRKKISDQVCGQVRDKVWYQVWDKVSVQVMEHVFIPIDNQLYEKYK
jgi:hypothetical protein